MLDSRDWRIVLVCRFVQLSPAVEASHRAAIVLRRPAVVVCVKVIVGCVVACLWISVGLLGMVICLLRICIRLRMIGRRIRLKPLRRLLRLAIAACWACRIVCHSIEYHACKSKRTSVNEVKAKCSRSLVRAILPEILEKSCSGSSTVSLVERARRVQRACLFAEINLGWRGTTHFSTTDAKRQDAHGSLPVHHDIVRPEPHALKAPASVGTCAIVPLLPVQRSSGRFRARSSRTSWLSSPASGWQSQR